jgi:hypothetical protein
MLTATHLAIVPTVARLPPTSKSARLVPYSSEVRG